MNWKNPTAEDWIKVASMFAEAEKLEKADGDYRQQKKCELAGVTAMYQAAKATAKSNDFIMPEYPKRQRPPDTPAVGR